MSHLSKIELEVKDLETLSKACRRMGLDLIKGQDRFRWFGQDADCDHAIKVPGADYEIGVVRTNGRYELQCDFFDRNIEKAIGPNAGLLKQAYAVEKARTEARRKGYSVMEKQTEAGIRLYIRMP